MPRLLTDHLPFFIRCADRKKTKKSIKATLDQYRSLFSSSLSSGGVISGISTQAGTFTGTVTASSGYAPDASQAFSITIVTTPPPALNPEPLFSAGATNAVSWTSVSGATQYDVQASTDPGFSTVVDSGWISGTTYTFAGLAPGSTYYYRVRAYAPSNGLGTSWSQATPTDFGPDAATNVVVASAGMTLDPATGYGPTGSLVSTLIAPVSLLGWGTLNYTVDVTGSGTALTVDVLDANGALLASNVSSGTDLSTLPAVATASGVQLRASLSTSNSTNTPTLQNWSLSYYDQPDASPWSTSVSSIQQGPPSIGNATPPVNALLGSAYNFTYAATGAPAPTFTVSQGALPPGLTLSSAGVISGAPTAVGTYTGTVDATNGIGADATQNFTITVAPQFIAPAIANGPPPVARVNTAYNFAFTTSGYPVPTFSMTSGTLPAGITLSSSGVISGTPTATGSQAISVSASNGVGTAATQKFSFIVQAAPSITSATPSAATLNTAYTFTVKASGYPVPTFTVLAGALPPGLTLTSGGVISGTPTTAGTYAGTVNATNGVSPAATQNFSISVNQAPSITNGPPPAGTVDAAYSFAFASTGYPAPTYSITAGFLPPGLTLSSDGAISGTPTVAGSYPTTVKAQNGVGTGATQTFVLVCSGGAASSKQKLYWDLTTAAGLANGSGTWDTGVNAKWSTSTAGSNPLLPWADDDNAFFQTAGTITATVPSGSTIKLSSLTQAVVNTALTVTGGTLQIDTNAGIVTAAGTNHSIVISSPVVLNSDHVIIESETSAGSVQLNGVVSEIGGSRALTMIGTGTITLGPVVNTFSGGVTLASSGPVVFLNNASFGTGPITFNAGTSLTSTAQIVATSTGSATVLANNLVVTPGSFGSFTGSRAMIFSGGLSGSGTFLINTGIAAASVTLSGDNHAFNGTLVYNDNGTTPLLLGSTFSGSPGAIWTLTGGSTKGIGANVGGANIFLLGELSSASGIGRLFNNQTTGTATFQLGDATANTPSFGGVITDGGTTRKVAVTMTGTDNQVLTGINTYTGPTTISGGILTVNGSLAAGSSVSVNAGGTLAGTGTITGPASVASGGILAPGQGGTATLKFAGGVNLANGAILNLDLGAVGSSDQISLTGKYVEPTSGTVTINLNAVAGFGTGTYTLIAGASGISVNSFSLGTTPGYGYQLGVSGSALTVTVFNAPDAPAQLAATLPTSSQVYLSWTPSANATSYNVKRATTSGGPYTTVGSPTGTNFVDSGLSSGAIYYYVVSAVNSAGEGINSYEISALTLPGVVVDVTASASSTQVTFNWDPTPGATTYSVGRATSSGGPYTIIANNLTGTTYSDSGLTNGVIYYYVVTGFDASGAGLNSTEISAIPLPPFPSIPTGLAAVAGDGQVSLNWDAATDATSYNVKRSTTAGGPYTTVASPTGTSVVDSGLTNGTTYYYVVTSLNLAGESVNSLEVNATPLPPVPAVPTGLAAIAVDGQVSLNWSAATGATGYNVYRATTAGGPYTTVASPTGTSGIDSGLTDGTTYYYVVTATNLGGESANSSEVNATPMAGLALPGMVTGLVAVAGDGRVSLNWNAGANATSYNVKRAATAGGPYTTVTSPTGTSTVDTGVTNGTTYYYVVTTVDPAGESGNSTEVSAKPMPPIAAAPTGFAAMGGNGQVLLSWNAATGATSYNVKRATTAGGPYITVASPTNPGTIDSGLTNGATYYYVVTSVNLGGESGNSVEVNATPLPPIPTAPTGLAVVAGNGQVSLSWTTVSGAATYTIGRSTVSGGPYTTVASGLATNSYVDTGLTNGVSYYYVVAAVNLAGTGPNSSEVIGMPMAPNLYWDTSTAAGLANGSGNWDTGVTAKWSNSSTGTSSPLLTWGNDDNAFFQTGGTMTATVPSSATIKLSSLTQAVVNTALTVTGGTLQIDSNAGIVTAAGTNHSLIISSAIVLNSANVIIDSEASAGSVQLNGVVSEIGGSRALTKIGSGTFTLGTVANTFSGGVTLNAAGQIAFGHNASFGTGPITFNAGTSLTSTAQIFTSSNGTVSALANNLVVTPGSFGAFVGNRTMILSGGLLNPGGGGNGTFSIAPGTSAASVTLSGDNHAYAGSIVYNDNGTTILLLGSVNSGSANASWTLTGGSTKGIGASVSGANTFQIGELTSASGIGRLFNNQASGMATFQIGDGTANSPSFGGIVADGTAGGTVAVTKTGADTQVLTGVNTYTGPTTINSGTLTINGSLAAGSTVTVNSGATLAGSGKINGAANLASGGVLSPGGDGAAATLTLAGGLSLNGGGGLNFDLAATTASDKIALTGAYIAPASGIVTINLNALSGFGAGTYTLITGASGISTASFTLRTVPPGYTYQLSVASGVLSVIVGGAPSTPTGLAATTANAEVDLSWSASTGATSYSVLRGTASGGPYTAIASGITTTTYADKSLTNGTTYYYVVTATNAVGTSGNSNQAGATPAVTATPIVDSWLDNDIGTVAQTGSSSYSAGTFTLNGSGTGIGGTTDGIDYTYQTLVGDGTIIARVASQTAGESGVMIRETLTGNASEVALLLQLNIGAVFQYRTATGGGTATGATVSSTTAPYWVKLARTGNVFTGFTSPDGVTWTQVGTVTDAMASSVYVGLMQSSVTNTALSTGTFTNVSIVPASAWASQDIGTVPIVGASYYSNGVATVQGTGASLYTGADQFRYTYVLASGDCDITARVVSETNSNTAAKTGVMIRAGLTATAAHAFVYLTPGSGVGFEWRSTTGGTTTNTTTTGIKAPYWLRLVRIGSTFTAYRSIEGATWTTIGSQTITMSTAVYIGLPVCSYNTAMPCTTIFDNIIVDP